MDIKNEKLLEDNNKLSNKLDINYEIDSSKGKLIKPIIIW